MKSLIAVALLLIVSMPAAAQIPNASFESWNAADTTVVDWLTSSTFAYPTVARVSPGHSGSYALQGMVAGITFYGIPPVVTAGPDGVFPYTQRPAALNGWFKFAPASDADDFLISVSLVQGPSKTGVAGGARSFRGAVQTFTQFSVPLTYVSAVNPDSAIIIFTVGHGVQADFDTPGSLFVIDDIAFGDATAVAEAPGQVPSRYALSQNYPNPFNPTTAITFQVPKASNVKLTVYDLLGRDVATLVNEQKSPGTYSVRFDASSLSSGMYMYRLEAGTYTATRRMTLLK